MYRAGSQLAIQSSNKAYPVFDLFPNLSIPPQIRKENSIYQVAIEGYNWQLISRRGKKERGSELCKLDSLYGNLRIVCNMFFPFVRKVCTWQISFHELHALANARVDLVVADLPFVVNWEPANSC
jgi:hypothetical protein